jgi:PAS domain S-box-containing protein
MNHEHILVVDDEPSIARFCARILSQAGYAVRECTDPERALELLDQEPFDLMLVDLTMPKLNGLELIRQAKVKNPSAAAIIMTGYGTLHNAIDALQVGARRFLLKPLEPQEILTEVNQALIEYRQEQEDLRSRILLPILQISQTLIAEGDLTIIADRLIEAVSDQLQSDRALLFMLDESREVLYAVSGAGFSAEQMDEIRLPGDGARIEGLLHTFPQRLSTDEAWLHDHLPGIDAREIAALAWAPLQFGGSIVGAMLLIRSQPHPPFTPDDLEMMSIIEGQIATGLENARLYDEIRTTRDRFRTTLNSLHDQVVVLDRDYTIVDANQTFLDQTGLARGAVIGHPCYEVTHRRDAPCQDPEQPCLAAEVWRTGQPARGLHIQYNAAGTKAYVDVAASPLFDASGQVYRVVQAYRDVTAEHLLQERLAAIQTLGRKLVLRRDSEQIAQAVVDAAEDLLAYQYCGLWLIDRRREQLVRQAATRAAKGSAVESISLEGANGITVAVVRQGRPIYVPDVRQDGRYIDGKAGNRSELCVPLTVQGRTIGVLNAESPQVDGFDAQDQQLLATLADQAALALENADLYEKQRQAQEHLIQSEKLTALGRLAASLAHEINNPLQALSSGLRLLKRAALAEEKRQQYIDVASREVDRLIGIVERMLGFYRPSADRSRPTDLHDLLNEILALAAKKIEHSRVTVERQWADDVPRIHAVANRLKQVFLNLILNALAAMPDGGTLTISTFVQDENRVAVRFTDTGCGIEPQHIDRIFEPFYTTKINGTGLGLSISYSIIEQHGGKIAVESEPGEGATFTVTLPIRESGRRE